MRDFLQTATLIWQLLSLRPAGLFFRVSALEPFLAVVFSWNVYCRSSSGNSFPQHINFCWGTSTTAPLWRKGLGLSKAETEENRTGKKKGRLMIDKNSCKQEQFSLIMPLVLFHRIATLFNTRSSIYHSAAAIPIVISTRIWALCLPLFDIWSVFNNNFIFKRNFCDQLCTHSIRNFLSKTSCWVFFTAWICAFPPRLSLPFSPSVAASGTPVLSPTQ